MAQSLLKGRLKFKIWITDEQGQVLFGPGITILLEAVDRNESLTEAAQELNMSYRALWGKLKKAEQRLGIKLLEKKCGGHGQGGSTLTTEAKELVAVYKRFCQRSYKGLTEDYHQLFKPFLIREPLLKNKS